MTADQFTNALETINAQVAALKQFVSQSPNLSPELLAIAHELEDATEVLQEGASELQANE